MVLVYVLYSFTIDGIDILCSVPTFGRELRFPLHIHLSILPQLIYNNTEYVVSYIRFFGFY